MNVLKKVGFILVGLAAPLQCVYAALAVQPLSAGYEHTCALKSTANDVECWGDNSEGQLGVSSPNGSYTPIQVHLDDSGNPLPQMYQVGAGQWANCTLDGSGLASGYGTVWCWGTGLMAGSTARTLPHKLLTSASLPFTNVSSIAVSGGIADHMCAVKTDGTVWCWGTGNRGQLGNNSTANSQYPVQVVDVNGSPLTHIAYVAVSGWYSCAVQNNSGVYNMLCWGYNATGQLGDGTTTTRAYAAYVKNSNLTLLSGINGIALGDSTNCANNSSGLWCWGDLNNTGTAYSTWPYPAYDTSVTQITDAISTGDGRARCAQRTGHVVWCGGSNMYGEIGDGTTTDSFYFKHTLNSNGTNFTLSGNGFFGGGYVHTCVLDEGTSPFTVYCWGSNAYGEVGYSVTGSGSTVLNPFRVSL